MLCTTCGQPSARSLLGCWYCYHCAEEILEPIRDRVFIDEGGIGWGRQAGPLLPEWGERFARIECGLCAATWVGVIGEQCGYCMVRLERLLDDTRQALLHPNLTTDPQRRHLMLRDWAKRLAGAVREGVIEEGQARAAWQREVTVGRRTAA